MIVCFLTSRCKNKVTSMTDPECNVHHKNSTEKTVKHMEPSQKPKGIFSSRLSETPEDRPARSPHSLEGTRQNGENSTPIALCPRDGSHQPETDWDRFECSELRASKSERQGLPKCSSAPVVHGFGVKRSGDAEDPVNQTTVKLHPNTPQLPSEDPGYSGREMKTDVENNISSYQRLHDHLCSDTGLLTYFEAQIESIGTLNATNIIEGAIKVDNPSPENDVGSSKGANSMSFGKKSKTWSTFNDPQNGSNKYHPESYRDPGRTITVFNGNKRGLQREPREGSCNLEGLGECSHMKDDDSQRDEDSASEREFSFFCSASTVLSPKVGASDMEMKHRVDHVSERQLRKEQVDVKQIREVFSGGQEQWKSTDCLSECDFQEVQHRRKEPGPSGPKKKETTKNKEKYSLLHDRFAREKFWKYHTNCCDESQPCQTASTVLKRLKTFDKRQISKETKLEPPSDEDLLEERTSLPLLPSKSSESHMSPNPAISSKKTCVSLPNLSSYDNQNASVTPHLIYTDPAITDVEDTIAQENRSKELSLCNQDLPVIGFPARGPVSNESRFNNVSPSNVGLPVINAPSGSNVNGEERAKGVSSSKLELPVIDCQTECLIRNDSRVSNVSPSNQDLPVIDDGPAENIVRGEERLQDMSHSNPGLPVIDDGPAENIVRGEDVSPSNPGLPVIDGPAENIVRGEERLLDMSPSNPGLLVITDDGAVGDIVRGEERLQDVPPSNPGLPVIDGGPAGDIIRGEERLQDGSLSNPGLLLITDDGAVGDFVGGEERLQDVPPSNPVLPVIDYGPAGDIRGEERLQDVSPSNPGLPVIDDGPAGDIVRGEERLQDGSPSNPVLPVIVDDPAWDIERGENRLEDGLTSNLDLTVIDVQTEGLLTTECRLNNVPPCNLPASGVPGENRIVGKGSSIDQGILRRNQNIRAKSCPVFSEMLDFETEDTRQNLDSLTSKSNFRQKISEQGTGTVPPIYPTNNKVDNSDVRKCETSPHDPLKSVETMTNRRQVTHVISESTLPHKQQELSRAGFSDISLNTQTQLTPSGSYSNSSQDGDDISEWPKTEDILKRSSTISLSSNYDILGHHTVPHCKADTEHLDDNSSTLLHDGERNDNTGVMNIQSHYIDDHLTVEAEAMSFHCRSQNYDQETEDRMTSTNNEKKTAGFQNILSSQNLNHKETFSEKNKSQNTVDTYNTSKDQSDNRDIPVCIYPTEMQMAQVERQRDTDSNTLDSPFLNNRAPDHIDCTDQMQACNLDTTAINNRTVAHLRSEDSFKDQTKVSLDTAAMNDQPEDHVGCHLFIPVMNRQTQGHLGREDPSKGLSSPHGRKVLIRPGTNAKTQENRNITNIQVAVGTDQAASNVGLEDILNERPARDMPDFSHREESQEEVDQVENLIGSEDKLGAASSYSQVKAATDDQEDDQNGSEAALREQNLEVSGYVSAGKDETKNTFVCNMMGGVMNDQSDGQVNAGAADNKLSSPKVVGGKRTSRKTLGDQNSETNKTFKICNKVPLPTIKENKPDLKDYLSARLSRRPFHSVFALSAKPPGLEDGEGWKRSTLEEPPPISGSNLFLSSHMLADGSTQNSCTYNHPEVLVKKTMDTTGYLTYLYARSPKLKMSRGPFDGTGRADYEMDDISILANLNFCKVAGSLPVVTENLETALDVQEADVVPILEPSKPDHIYLPPSKEELKADDELTVLNVIYNLKKSLEQSEMSNMESITDK